MAGSLALDTKGLVVDLEVKGPCAATGPVTLTLRVSNPTTGSRTFCRYHTPFEGLLNDIFRVTAGDGVARPYRGEMVKRCAPRAEDFLRLEPGQSRSADVDLCEGWLLGPGLYTVVFPGNGVSGLPASKPVSVRVEA